MLKEIVFESKEEAERVLEYLCAVIFTLGDVNVSNYYKTAGRTAEPEDEEYGWLDLTGVTVQPGAATRYIDDGTQEIAMGYIITLPEPIRIIGG